MVAVYLPAMKNVDRPAIRCVISELIAANEHVSNQAMADEIISRLNIPVTGADISRFRGEIGLNIFQLSERVAFEQVNMEIEDLRRAYAKVGVPDLHSLPLAEIINLRAEKRELLEQKDELLRKLTVLRLRLSTNG
jgi:hypothetical protein